jgi:uncharacterized protein YjiS (DUF1127 family)
MEPEMPGNSEFDVTLVDYQSLSPRQREVLVQRIIRQAHAEQARAIRAALRTMVMWLRSLVIMTGTALVRWWRAYADGRRYRKQMAELQELSDRDLKDIGVRRSEIYWVVHHGREIPDVGVAEKRPRIIRADPMAATSAKAPGAKRRVRETPAAA